MLILVPPTVKHTSDIPSTSCADRGLDVAPHRGCSSKVAQIQTSDFVACGCVYVNNPGTFTPALVVILVVMSSHGPRPPEHFVPPPGGILSGLIHRHPSLSCGSRSRPQAETFRVAGYRAVRVLPCMKRHSL